IGAWSFSPSPMTTTPFMLTVPIKARMASTAAPSPPFLSPRPTHRPAAIAAASVTRTSSRARLRSGAGRSARKSAGELGVSDSGSDTGPPGSTTGCCDPRCMTGDGPTGDRLHPTPDDAGPVATGAPPQSSAIERAKRLSMVNMLRSLLPLLVIVLLVVGWTAFRQSPDVAPVRPVETASTVQLAASRAGYQLVVPTGLPDGYRPTSARTDAGHAGEADPVTLQIGYVTPADEFAGFVVTDDRRATALTAVLNGAEEQGTVAIGGQTWTRSTTRRGETALSRETDGVTVVVSGSASEAELETGAGSMRPYSG